MGLFHHRRASRKDAGGYTFGKKPHPIQRAPHTTPVPRPCVVHIGLLMHQAVHGRLAAVYSFPLRRLLSHHQVRGREHPSRALFAKLRGGEAAMVMSARRLARRRRHPWRRSAQRHPRSCARWRASLQERVRCRCHFHAHKTHSGQRVRPARSRSRAARWAMRGCEGGGSG